MITDSVYSGNDYLHCEGQTLRTLVFHLRDGSGNFTNVYSESHIFSRWIIWCKNIEMPQTQVIYIQTEVELNIENDGAEVIQEISSDSDQSIKSIT